MRRRDFLIATATAAATGSVACPAQSEGSLSPAGERPNILFILTDQQSANMMSCTGNGWLKTPALDRLASEGTRFERSYACNAVCVPNRFSFQTGLMPSAIGMGKNGDSKESLITDGMRKNSLGNLFRRGGYETVYGGKVHLPRTMNNLGKMGYRDLGRDARAGLAESCAEFIRGEHKKPFMMFASFINPHDICYMALNEHRVLKGEKPVLNIDAKTCDAILNRARKFKDLDAFIKEQCPPLPANHEPPKDEPECITTNYLKERSFRAYARNEWKDSDWRLHRWAYARLTEMVDAEIGIVLDALRDSGLADNTLVVFTSDHGDMDGAHRMEHKSVLYEESVRIPFIMRYPGKIPANRVDEEHLVSNGMDLMPTLCDYAGIDMPEGRNGKSLRPLATGQSSAAWRDSVVVESQNGRMARTDQFKYCVYDSGQHREFLIDLKNDPGEMHNLAGHDDYRDVLKTHRALLRDGVEKNHDAIGRGYII
jgi:arylsulfatase A-like enzyme